MSHDIFAKVPAQPTVAFLGASIESAQVLRALIDDGIRVSVAVTKEPKRRSRGSGATSNPVEVVANDAGIDVSYELEGLLSKSFDLAVVVAFGVIIPSNYIEQWPFLNIHYSLLPRWRGAAPVERAILAGDATTGVALMEIVEALDAGRVFDLVEVSIEDHENATSLRQRLTEVGIERLLEALHVGGDFFKNAVEQVGDVTYAKKIKKDEFRITGTTLASEVLRFERVSRPFGVSPDLGRISIFDCSLVDVVDLGGFEGDSIPVGVLRGDILRLSDGWVRVGSLQVEGKRAMSVAEFRRGNRSDVYFVS